MPPPPSAERIRKAIRAVKDPELNLNIIDIGLVYEVDVDEAGSVQVQVTLTSPGCPAGAEIIAGGKRGGGEPGGGCGRWGASWWGIPTGRRRRWIPGFGPFWVFEPPRYAAGR